MLLNLIHKMKYLTDEFQLCFFFVLATLNSYISFVYWQHSWHPCGQLASC